MFKLILCAALAFAAIAHADEKATRFKTLAELYQKGTTPTIEELTGWFTGRCYSAEKPNAPINDLLVGEPTMVDGDGGPIFPGSKALMLYELGGVGDINLYDSMDEKKIFDVEAVLQKVRTTREPAFVAEDGALKSVPVEKNGLNYNIKKYDAVFIGKDVSNPSGENSYMCYFFKKVN